MSEQSPPPDTKPKKTRKPKGITIKAQHIVFSVLFVIIAILWIQVVDLANQTRATVNNDDIQKLNSTQSTIINWINNRQEPFNNDVISWASNMTQKVNVLEGNITTFENQIKENE